MKAACTNCKKAKARCDHGRPCTRCVERGLTDCVDAFPRRVGRRRNHFFNHIVTESEVRAVQPEKKPKAKSKPRKKRTRAKTRKPKRTRDQENVTPPMNPVNSNKRFKPDVPALKLADTSSLVDEFLPPSFSGDPDVKLDHMPTSVFSESTVSELMSDFNTDALVQFSLDTPKFDFAPVKSDIKAYGVRNLSINSPSMERGLSFLDEDLSSPLNNTSLPLEDSCSETCSSSSCSDLPFSNEEVGSLDVPSLGSFGLDSDVFSLDFPQDVPAAY